MKPRLLLGEGSMTREELEAFIWRAMTVHRIRGPHTTAFVNDILDAAGKHAVHVGGITAERRAVLTESDSAVHYHQSEDELVSVCGMVTAGRPGPMTVFAGKVTCGRCRRTSAWRSLAGAR